MITAYFTTKQTNEIVINDAFRVIINLKTDEVHIEDRNYNETTFDHYIYEFTYLDPEDVFMLSTLYDEEKVQVLIEAADAFENKSKYKELINLSNNSIY